MMLTLTLAAGLLAAPEPQAEPPKGWVVELRGYTYHRQAKPEEWIIELQDFTKHRKQAETSKGWIIEQENGTGYNTYRYYTLYPFLLRGAPSRAPKGEGGRCRSSAIRQGVAVRCYSLFRLVLRCICP